MAGFLDEIRAETSPKGPRCSVGVIAATLSTADRADLDAALRDGSIPGTAIARALSKRGPRTVQGAAVQHHRKGECGCV